MLCGTGIAEVLLPLQPAASHKNSKHVKLTEPGSKEEMLDQNLPLHFRRGPAKTKNQSIIQKDLKMTTCAETSNIQNVHNDDVFESNAPSSYSHNFQLHKHQWHEQLKQKEESLHKLSAITNVDNDVVATKANVLNDQRIGFQATRLKQNSAKGFRKYTKQEKNNDK